MRRPIFYWPEVLDFAQRSAISIGSPTTEGLDDYAMAYTHGPAKNGAVESAIDEPPSDCFDDSDTTQTPPPPPPPLLFVQSKHAEHALGSKRKR